MKREVLRMERVTYKEQEVVLLDDFNFSVYAGEIMGMIPINSYGKTGFFKLLQVNLPLYDGYIYYNGIKVNSWKESLRGHNRISIIQANSSLVESMNVAENIFVLRQGFGQEIIHTKLLHRQLVPFFQDIGMDIPADIHVERLTLFERVIVELLRAVVAGHWLIVLDEIGARISYEEMKKLHGILRHYAEKGFTFLYVSPHFEEIASVCDRAALLSNGRIQKVIPKDELAAEVFRIYPAEYDHMVRYHLENKRKNGRKKEEVLCWKGFSETLDRELGFCVYQGECLVVQAQEDKVIQELLQVVTGDAPPEAGEIQIEGKRVDYAKSTEVAVIQELPTKTMIFPELDYMENLSIGLMQRMPSVSWSRRVRENIRRECGPVLGMEVFDLSMEELSERQKYQLVYTRVLLQKPHVVFCVSPFKGADVSHRMFIWKLLEQLLNRGIAVVVLSPAMSDTLSLADRILMLENNSKIKEITSEDFFTIPEQVPWNHLYKINHEKMEV